MSPCVDVSVLLEERERERERKEGNRRNVRPKKYVKEKEREINRGSGKDVWIVREIER